MTNLRAARMKSAIPTSSHKQQVLHTSELLLLTFPLITLLITALGFFLGISITPLHLWLSLALTAVLLFLLPFRNTNARQKAAALGVMLSILLISFIFASLIHKLTWDGQGYHQPSIASLHAGWNPFKDDTIEKWNPYYQYLIGFLSSLSVHFTRGTEMLGAVFYSATNILQSAKTFNIYFMILTFMVARRYLQKVDTISPRMQMCIALILALNPVAVTQMSTFYVDGILASLLTIMLITLLDFYQFSDRASLLESAVAFTILANIKFTGLVYGGVFIAFFLVCICFKKRNYFWRYFTLMSAAGSIAVAFIGYQPYVTNTIEHMNPFYPLIGSHADSATTVITRFINADFASHNLIERYIIALFDNKYIHLFGYNNPHFIIFNQSLTAAFDGFGFVFGYILLLSLILILLNGNLFWLCLTLTTFGSIFLTYMGWWTRFTPQQWLIPMLVVITYFVTNQIKRPIIRKCLSFSTVTLLVSSSVTTVIVLLSSVHGTIVFNKALNKLKTQTQTVYVKERTKFGDALSTTYYLKQHGIQPTLVAKIPNCKQKMTLPYILNSKVYWNCSEKNI